MITQTRHFQSAALAVLAALVGNASVRATDDPLAAALQAAFRPPATPEAMLFIPKFDLPVFIPRFEIAGHQFGVAPATTLEIGDDNYVVRGVLTHFANPGAKGEAIEYRIFKQQGGSPLQRAEVRLVPGRWTPLAGPLSDAMTGFRTGRTLTREQQLQQRRLFESATTQALDGTWRRAAEFLIARIALGDGC